MRRIIISKKRILVAIYLTVLFLIIALVMKNTFFTIQSGLQTSNKPFIILIPGYGSGLTPDDYSYFVNTYTKNGYFVMKYYPSYTNIYNYTTLVKAWTNDIAAMAENHRVIVIGHSVGGAVAMHFCATSKLCAASISLDGGQPIQYEIISAPNLYLQGEVGSYCDKSCLGGRNLAVSITKNSHGEIMYMKGLKHMNFTDFALDQGDHQDLASEGYFGTIDGKKGLDEINNKITRFLSKAH